MTRRQAQVSGLDYSLVPEPAPKLKSFIRPQIVQRLFSAFHHVFAPKAQVLKLSLELMLSLSVSGIAADTGG
jgi:hypothetical protein